MTQKDDCCREAWEAGVDACDKIFCDTIREAMARLDHEDFIKFLVGFIGIDTKKEGVECPVCKVCGGRGRLANPEMWDFLD